VVPEIVENPQDILQLTEPVAVFNCSASGIPLPTITWNFQSGDATGPVETQPMLSVTSRIVTSRLTITGVTVGNFGSYSCVANNLFDPDDSTSARLESRKCYYCKNKCIACVCEVNDATISIL